MVIYFWQNIISPHQYPYIKLIKKHRPDWIINLVVSKPISSHRKEMGWDETQEKSSDVNIIISPEDSYVYNIMKEEENSIHIISGFRICPLVNKAFNYAIKYKRKVGIISESPVNIGIKSLLRNIYGFSFGERRFRKKVDFVLCIGSLSKLWYKKMGYSENKLYDFCYVIDSHNKFLHKGKNNNQTTNFIFVGQLIKRKGIDILLPAFLDLKKSGNNITLSIIGDGPFREYIHSFINLHNLHNDIFLLGRISNKKVTEFISAYDCLILPSYFDGWGAVINEAFMAGIPTICSNNCGASDLIANSNIGAIFIKGNHKDLIKKIEEQSGLIKDNKYNSSIISKWSENIEGNSVANYFIKIIEYQFNIDKERPKAPWLNY